MPPKYRLPGRNLHTPSGKVAALFVDLDGTTVACEENFQNAKRRFEHLMGMCGFNKQRAAELAKQSQLELTRKHGFERDVFSLALKDAYGKLCAEKKKKPNPLIVGLCEDIGNAPFFRTNAPYPNAAPVLGRARHNFLIIAVSIGNREAQKFKVRQAGLDPVFDKIVVTPNDNKLQLVRELIEDLDIDPEFSAFIGNSKRSDGASLHATNFIHLPFESWDWDEAELPTDTGFAKFEANSWREAEEHAIERLIRRREQAFLTTDGSHTK